MIWTFVFMFGGVISAAQVKISVFYEPLCIYSNRFIVNHLVPTIDKDPKGYDIKFVPYGRAKTSEIANGPTTTYYFTCTHGETECVASKMHSCAIQHVRDKSLLIDYITCMMATGAEMEDYELAGRQCTVHCKGVAWEEIRTCYQGDEGMRLLKRNGQLTEGLDPSVSFTPAVLINDKRLEQTTLEILLGFDEVSTYFCARERVGQSAGDYADNSPNPNVQSGHDCRPLVIYGFTDAGCDDTIGFLLELLRKAEYKGVKYINVDVVADRRRKRQFDVETVPTFVFYRSYAVDRYEGTDKQELEQRINKWKGGFSE